MQSVVTASRFHHLETPAGKPASQDVAIVRNIVDDEDSIRRSLDFLLRSAGYRTERWEDGESFLRSADRTVPACVLLDVHMPGMDGLQIQAEMRARGYNMPVINDVNLVGITPVRFLDDGRGVYAAAVNANTRVDPRYNRVRLVQSVGESWYRALTLQRKVIDFQLLQNDTGPAEASLNEYLKDARLADAERSWAQGKKAQLLVDKGNFIEADMVGAFIQSSEYRARFGP